MGIHGEPGIKREKLRPANDLVDDLYWDYDRMSSSGQETLDKMAKLLGLPTFDDVENAND